jgi:poly-gamma-glutamate synthesis protein (capsule biosynthesis protein)
MGKKQLKLLSQIGMTIVALTVGIAIAAGIFSGASILGTTIKSTSVKILAYINKPVTHIEQALQGQPLATTQALFDPNAPIEIKLGNVSDGDFSPPESGKVIRINLDTMQLDQYEDGTLKNTMKVLSKGKVGSYWETPGGNYTVLTKEEKHLSSMGQVWMPWSMQFFGNYFIHGWPYYPNGNPVTDIGYSGGCIRLSNDDAKSLYKWADLRTEVSIYNTKGTLPKEVALRSPYFLRNPNITPQVSAGAFVVGDIESGDILLQKNMNAIHPIASVSKLMTALVALDIVHQRAFAKISNQALATSGQNAGFTTHDHLKNSDILYPLLMQSSNDAAEILAEQNGRKSFIIAMNEKVGSLGLLATSFDDPSGLSAKNTSTALDLFKLVRHISTFKNYIFDITTTKQYSTSSHAWVSSNQFLNVSGYVGGKSGYTDPAKQTGISLFKVPISEFETRTIAVTLLQSDDRRTDVLKLMDYVKKNMYLGAPRAIKVATNTATPSKKVSLLFGGDIMLDRGVKTSVEKNFGGDYNKLFDNIGSIKDADITFVNLEGPVSDVGNNVGSKYSFRMDPKVLPALLNAGIDIVSFANNHVGDWNKAAFNDTLGRLTKNGILYTGAGSSKAQAEEPTIIEKNGLKVGYLGFSDVGPDWVAATDKASGILLASDPDFEGIIRRARAKVDILIVSVHWGTEYKEHTAHQSYLAHRAIDNGASLVIGHHPHVEQATETYKDGLIVYSLGNFIFDQYFSPETMQGLIVSVDFDGNKITTVTKSTVKLNTMYQPESITPKE